MARVALAAQIRVRKRMGRRGRVCLSVPRSLGAASCVDIFEMYQELLNL